MALRPEAVNGVVSQRALGGPGGAPAWLAGLARRTDLLVAAGMVLLLVMMVVPLPPLLLDVLLVANMTVSLVALLVTMYTRDALELSVFPSLLLVATLFRLALNVSSTRLILLHGYAGQVIQQFGAFVVGGNPVVGFIIFLILVIIQFVVITRGAERVAEVAARFTLDAMPGKQMSIDADLNAGLISEEEARRRRRLIAQEADFYGAMDGAAKFIKGDAIAGIIITLINVCGGLLVGMVQRGLTFGQALQQYTLLTVGDGLVTQLPALLIATATGFVVTRAASEHHLGHDLASQLLGNHRVLQLAAGVLALLGLVPGLPVVPFMIMAAVFFFMARRRAAQEAAAVEAPEPEEAVEQPEADDLTDLIQVDPLEIELGYGLLSLADEERPGHLLDRVAGVRRQVAADLGMILPLIRVRDNMELPPTDYTIKLRGQEVARGTLLSDHYLAIGLGGGEEEIPGIPTRDPAFGLEAMWIREEHREQAELAGCTVVDPGSVLATHLTRVIRQHGWQLLGRQEVKNLLDHARERAPALVDDLIPDQLKLGDVQKVLRNLLREGLPIRDLLGILETLADRAATTRDPDVLTEYVRQGQAGVIGRQLGLTPGRPLPVMVLGPDLEEELSGALRRGEEGTTYLSLPPERLQWLTAAMTAAAQRMTARGQEPVLLAPPLVRLHLRRAIEAALPDMPVISYGELPASVQVDAVEEVGQHAL